MEKQQQQQQQQQLMLAQTMTAVKVFKQRQFI
jgi:hypothetical protein